MVDEPSNIRWASARPISDLHSIIRVFLNYLIFRRPPVIIRNFKTNFTSVCSFWGNESHQGKPENRGYLQAKVDQMLTKKLASIASVTPPAIIQ